MALKCSHLEMLPLAFVCLNCKAVAFVVVVLCTQCPQRLVWSNNINLVLLITLLCSRYHSAVCVSVCVPLCVCMSILIVVVFFEQ